MTVKAVSLVAKSGTGKTTLLEKVVARLKERGYRVGVIKHDAHSFNIDHPGKDSYRLTAAGADTILISSPEKLALVKKNAASPPVEKILATYFSDMDIVLTEGFKRSSLPKIEIHRRERSATLLCRGEEHDPMLLAVASDEKLELDVPVLDVNDDVGVAAFIEKRFLRGIPAENVCNVSGSPAKESASPKKSRVSFLVVSVLALTAVLALAYFTVPAFHAFLHPHKGGTEASVAKGVVKYTCPMHPNIVSDKPDACPICGMTLVLQPNRPQLQRTEAPQQGRGKGIQ